MALLAGSASAALLVEETFDYGVGSASSTWNGGTGFSSTAWSPGTTGTTLDNGLTLGNMQVAGGSAHIQFTAGGSFSAGTMGRSLNTSSVSSGDLWMAYLLQFDTARSSIPLDEALEVRPGAGDIRTKIDENSSGIGVNYGGAWSTSVDPAVKDGTTLLFVSKFSDLGAATGDSSRGWGMTASEYDSMMANGGVSETNLDTYAGIQITKAFSANETMAGNVSMQLVPIGRNSSTPSFYVDELRLGTTVNDVVAIPEPATLGLVVLIGGGLAMLRRLVV
ncbi:MAG: PEP-CTERM sorting domain-containing protein [Verrucomicrobiota bacterium]|nr:PEP-CTERM sorting domain-containing protein [Verrucomicrobiota bacterium]